jgi:glycine cleavage system H lipoate-binding protein
MTVVFVVVTILLFLGIDWLVTRAREKREAAPATAAAPRAATGGAVRLPDGVFFARSHTWLSLFPSGQAWLGVDDFVIRMLEKPEITLLKPAGSQIARGEPILTLRENGHALTIRSPVEGEVLAYNSDLIAHPELLKSAPFNEGWAYGVRPTRIAELKQMLLGDETRLWMREEWARLRDVFAGAGGAVSPAMLQDGGPPIAGAMKQLDESVWRRFEQEFLQVR